MGKQLKKKILKHDATNIRDTSNVESIIYI